MHRGILNKKSLGPFRPVRPAGLDFQARPGPARFGPRAGPGYAISSYDIDNDTKVHYANGSSCCRVLTTHKTSFVGGLGKYLYLER